MCLQKIINDFAELFRLLGYIKKPEELVAESKPLENRVRMLLFVSLLWILFPIGVLFTVLSEARFYDIAEYVVMACIAVVIYGVLMVNVISGNALFSGAVDYVVAKILGSKESYGKFLAVYVPVYSVVILGLFLLTALYLFINSFRISLNFGGLPITGVLSLLFLLLALALFIWTAFMKYKLFRLYFKLSLLKAVAALVIIHLPLILVFLILPAGLSSGGYYF